MPEIFVDTAGWGNLLYASQDQHASAIRIYRQAQQQGRKLITTNYVMAELVALLTSPFHMPRATIIALLQDLRISSVLGIVHIDKALDEQAWELLSKRPDKDWSLVDCSSFVVMQQRGIQEALTTDHHFEQAGFTRLLKP
ncbi:MAG TPA: PIN domain-containing protein [Chloroflexia bacterium]|jgi:hypothetical protein